MTEASDGALVRRVLAGERHAFGVLVERHQDRMLAYVRYIGFDEPDACDVVQEAFVRGFRHLKRCRDPDRFAGWLFKIVGNTCRSAGARAARRVTEPLDAHAASMAAATVPPDEQADAKWLRETLRVALDQVSPDQKEALVLMYLQGYSVNEIEELTGASRSAVKMRLKRGREALKALLGPLLSEVSER